MWQGLVFGVVLVLMVTAVAVWQAAERDREAGRRLDAATRRYLERGERFKWQPLEERLGVRWSWLSRRGWEWNGERLDPRLLGWWESKSQLEQQLGQQFEFPLRRELWRND